MLTSVDDGLRRVWPSVSEYYAQVWDRAEPPPNQCSAIRHWLMLALADQQPRFRIIYARATTACSFVLHR